MKYIDYIWISFLNMSWNVEISLTKYNTKCRWALQLEVAASILLSCLKSGETKNAHKKPIVDVPWSFFILFQNRLVPYINIILVFAKFIYIWGILQKQYCTYRTSNFQNVNFLRQSLTDIRSENPTQPEKSSTYKENSSKSKMYKSNKKIFKDFNLMHNLSVHQSLVKQFWLNEFKHFKATDSQNLADFFFL